MKACTAFRCLLQNERVGAIGVTPNPPLTDTECAGLAAAAALLGPAVKNAELYSEVQENSVRDVLTGCFNRRHALHVLDSELRRTRRSHGAFSLVMFGSRSLQDHQRPIRASLGRRGARARGAAHEGRPTRQRHEVPLWRRGVPCAPA